MVNTLFDRKRATPWSGQRTKVITMIAMDAEATEKPNSPQ